MNKLIIALVALVLLVGGFFVLNNYIYQEKQADPETDVSVNEDATVETFTDETVGLSFEYKTAPDGYVVDDLSDFIGEEPQGIEVVRVYRIMNAQEKIELENSEGGREGPPTMQVMVFKNDLKQSASMWVDAFPAFSSIEMALGEVDRDAVVGGANAVRYLSDGLYVTENVVVANGSFIYHFTGSFHEKDSTIHQDFKSLVDSVEFVPEFEPTRAPAAKIDVQVACQSALAYMLFETGEQADQFVAECVAGEHPDVIDRYIEGLGLDGAVI